MQWRCDVMMCMNLSYVAWPLITAANSTHYLLCFQRHGAWKCAYSLSEETIQPTTSTSAVPTCSMKHCCCRGRDSDRLRCGHFLLMMLRGWPPAAHWRETASSPHCCSMVILTWAWQQCFVLIWWGHRPWLFCCGKGSSSFKITYRLLYLQKITQSMEFLRSTNHIILPTAWHCMWHNHTRYVCMASHISATIRSKSQP